MRRTRLISTMFLVWAASGCALESDASSSETTQALSGTDLTPTASANVTDLWGTQAGDEGLNKLHDGDIHTKFLKYGRSYDWIQYRMNSPAIITNYDITSANDEPERDPADWTFEASNDGLVWVVLDTRQDQLFSNRHVTNSYSFNNATAYLYYRLNISDNQGASRDLQLAEFRVGGSLASGPVPGTPAIGTATADSTSITVNWSAAANATSYVVQRLSDDGTRPIEFTTSASTYTDQNLVPGTTYVYQVQGVNGSLRGFPSAARARATTPGLPGGLKDITALSTFVPTDEINKTGFEGPQDATDNNTFTKYLRYGSATTWLQLRTPSDSVVRQYTLTSANDEPKRDPKSWTLQGSPDGTTWTTLDTRSNQAFADRYQRRTFSCNPNGLPFNHYRLLIQSNNGAPDVQLAEWRLLGSTGVNLGAPAAPSSLVASTLSSNQVKLTWTDNANQLNPESSFRIDRATDSTFNTNLVTKYAAANSREFRATGLDQNRTYYFRVSAANAAGSSAVIGPVSATTPANTALMSFRENGWYGGHNRIVNRAYYDGNVAIYYDELVPNPSSITWANSVFSEAWTYVKNTYGNFSDPVLYVVGNQDLAGDVYGGGGLIDVFSDEAQYRNLVWAADSNWASPYGWKMDALVHEMAHTVEFNNNGVWGSPSFAVWGDSKWADVFQYDIYRKVSAVPAGNAERIRDQWLTGTDDYGRYWFRDWYYPLYNGSFGNTAPDKNGSALLVKYFQLLAQHLPQIDSRYPRPLNLGEFVHFCAGAAGVDLEDEAKVAFRWTPDVELQYAKAQADFPAITALYKGNVAPGFTFDPITRFATVGAAWSGQTLAGSAVDPNAGNTLTYSKVSGASWLTVASNGVLGGTPTTVGTSSAVVRVTDQSGLSDTATLNVRVLAASVTPLNDGFETDFNLWTDSTTSTNWDRATDQKRAGTYAARCGGDDTTLTSDVLNTSGKQLLTVTFWYRDSGIDDDDQVFVQLYDGTTFRNVFELGNSAENAWNQYSVTFYASQDPALFRSNFRLRFQGTDIDAGEFLWIDDVRITAQ